MKTPMPSPNGSNYAGLYIGGRVEAAYDAAPLQDDDGKQMVDSSCANRILGAVADKLDLDDVSALIDAMADAGMMSPTEASAVKTMIAMEKHGVGEMASDSAVLARRRALYRDGKISLEMLRAPVVPPMSATARAAMMARFPDAGRLKR